VQICVVGCGAIGSLFAAHLAALGEAEVWVFDVSQAQVQAINDRGLRCTGTSGGLRGAGQRGAGRRAIQARADGAQIPPCELGIVATKSLHTDAALAATAGAFADAAVCSVQNGVGNEEVIARYEIGVLNGGIVREAGEAGVPVPLNQAVTALVNGLEQSWAR
jgi:2-dehydropantoate 2-reductase